MKHLRDKLLREESGFTLPELLVTMLMMLTVMFALYSIFDMGIRVFSYGNDKIEAVENARIGLARMEREIRAAYPQSGGVLLNTRNPSEIAFQNRPGSGSPTAITYKLSSDSPRSLQRNGQSVVEFVDGSSGLNFTYLKSNGVSAATTEPEIAIVRVNLKIRVPGVQDGTQELTTDINLRNR